MTLHLSESLDTRPLAEKGHKSSTDAMERLSQRKKFYTNSLLCLEDNILDNRQRALV